MVSGWIETHIQRAWDRLNGLDDAVLMGRVLVNHDECAGASPEAASNPAPSAPHVGTVRHDLRQLDKRRSPSHHFGNRWTAARV